MSSLGVSRANITDITCKLVSFAILYFIVNLWDSYLGLQSSLSDQLAKIRVYVTAGYEIDYHDSFVVWMLLCTSGSSKL